MHSLLVTYFVSWREVSKKELKTFCGDVSKGSEVGAGEGGGKEEPEGGRARCVSVLFFLCSTQWSFERTSLKRHSYSLCVKGVSAGRVC